MAVAPSEEKPRRPFPVKPVVALVCLCLCIRFAIIGLKAADTKSATYDEPLHAISAWVVMHHHDFRIVPEAPPLWKYWAAIPNPASALSADFHSKLWKSIPL